LFSGNLKKRKRLSIQLSMLVAMVCILGSMAVQAQNSTEPVQRRIEIVKNAQSTLDELLKTQPSSKELYDRAVRTRLLDYSGLHHLGRRPAPASRSTRRRPHGPICGWAWVESGSATGAPIFPLIVLFETQDHLKKFVAGGWDSSATAEAAAAKEGVAARATFMNGAAFYQVTEKGLMAHADVTGTKFWQVDDLN
jgi:hypothetical protein